MDIEGVSRRRRKMFTTIVDPEAQRAPDLVNGNFRADRPDALWVADLTHVPTPTGMAYVCFLVDAFSRRIVGWRVAGNIRTDMLLDALEVARRSPGNRRLVGLVAHSDAGRRFTSVRFTERLDEIGARPSIGTVADSYDDAPSETTNGLYKTECVFGPDAPRPWDDVDELELATLSWVHWSRHAGDPWVVRGGVWMGDVAFSPCLVRSRAVAVADPARHPLLDAYLELVAARGRPNTLLAHAYDLKVFFTVIDRDPVEVAPADVLAFIAEQRQDSSTSESDTSLTHRRL